MNFAAPVMIVFRTKDVFIVEYLFWKCVGILKENVSENVLTLMSKKVISISFCVCWILVKLKITCTIKYCGVFLSICLLLVLFHGQLLTSEVSFKSMRIICLRLWMCFLTVTESYIFRPRHNRELEWCRALPLFVKLSCGKCVGGLK